MIASLCYKNLKEKSKEQGLGGGNKSFSTRPFDHNEVIVQRSQWFTKIGGFV